MPGLKRSTLSEQDQTLVQLILWNSGNKDAMNLAVRIKKARCLILETME
jgi:hypothetical protein